MVSLAAVFVFAANPGLGCSAGEGFLFGEAEMRQAVEGTWVVKEAGQPEAAIEMVLRQSSKPDAGSTSDTSFVQQRACVSRELVRDAGACTSQTEMYVSGVVTAGAPAWNGVRVQGRYVVHGTTYRGGFLDLWMGTRVTLQVALDERDRVRSAFLRDEAGARAVVIERRP